MKKKVKTSKVTRKRKTGETDKLKQFKELQAKSKLNNKPIEPKETPKPTEPEKKKKKDPKEYTTFNKPLFDSVDVVLPPKPVGRPTEYNEDLCQKLIDHMAEGLSFESFGAVVFQGKSTLYEWATRHKDFAEARATGQELSRAYWEKLGRDYVISRSESITNVGSNSASINSAVYGMIMKNRFGYRDKQPDEVPVTNVVVQAPQVNEDLANKILAAVQKISEFKDKS